VSECDAGFGGECTCVDDGTNELTRLLEAGARARRERVRAIFSDVIKRDAELLKRLAADD